MTNPGQFPKSPKNKIYAQDVENLRRIPAVSAGAYTLNINNIGQRVDVSASVTVPTAAAGFQSGDVVTVYNPNSSAIPINSSGSPTPIYKIAGTDLTPVSLAGNGLATFMCVSAGSISQAVKFVVIGAGLA